MVVVVGEVLTVYGEAARLCYAGVLRRRAAVREAAGMQNHSVASPPSVEE